MAARSFSEIKGLKEVQDMLIEYREGGALELEQYRSIGTVEECREAMERQRAKKPKGREVGRSLIRKVYHCPNCDKRLYDCAIKNGELDHVSPGSRKSKFCDTCGQHLDWSDNL